jgi:chromosomal replication initiator protein
VAKFYELTVAKLTSPNREQKIALPRQVAMYLCRTLAGETLQQIADKFNKRDQTTVMAAEKRVRDLIATNPEVAAAVQTLTARLSP